MRKSFGPKSAAYPMPVFILAAYDESGTPNAMNAAWGGISEENEISICVSATHKTTENILLKKAFTVSMGTADQTTACDYVGLASGKQTPDKFEKAGFHALPAEKVDAPLIAELPVALECRLRAYDPETCRLVGEIVNVSVDEAVLDEQGLPDVRKIRPITYDSFTHNYIALGEIVGKAFHDGNSLR